MNSDWIKKQEGTDDIHVSSGNRRSWPKLKDNLLSFGALAVIGLLYYFFYINISGLEEPFRKLLAAGLTVIGLFSLFLLVTFPAQIFSLAVILPLTYYYGFFGFVAALAALFVLVLSAVAIASL
jgi:hypothetical protein